MPRMQRDRRRPSNDPSSDQEAKAPGAGTARARTEAGNSNAQVSQQLAYIMHLLEEILYQQSGFRLDRNEYIQDVKARFWSSEHATRP